MDGTFNDIYMISTGDMNQKIESFVEECKNRKEIGMLMIKSLRRESRAIVNTIRLNQKLYKYFQKNTQQ